MHIEELFNRLLLIIFDLLFFQLGLAFNGLFSFHIEFFRVHDYLEEGLHTHVVVDLEVTDSELSISLSFYFNYHKFNVFQIQEGEFFPS
jgi:hypothetical protein